MTHLTHDSQVTRHTLSALRGASAWPIVLSRLRSFQHGGPTSSTGLIIDILPPSCRKNLKLETSEQFLNRGLIQGCNHPKLWSSYVRSRRYVGPTFRNHHYGSYLSHQPDAIFSFRFMTETPKAPDIGQRLTSVSKHIFICHYIDDRTRYSREQKFCHGKELHVYYRRCSDFLVFTT